MNIPNHLMLDDRKEFLHLFKKTTPIAPTFDEAAREQATFARSKGHPLAYVCVYGSSYVSVVDVMEARRLVDINVGIGPLDIAINRHDLSAYVTNFTENTVSLVDLRGSETVITATSGKKPAGIKVSRDGRFVYLVHYGEPNVYVLNARSLERIAEIPLPSIGFQLDLTADGSLAFVSLKSTAQIAVVDLTVNLVVKVIPAGAGAEDVKVGPDRLAFVSNEDGDSITPVNVPLAESASSFLPTSSGPAGLVFTNGGSRLYCANRQDRSVSLYDVFTRRELKKIPAGNGPYGLTAVRSGLLLVSNSYEDTLSIIDTRKNCVTSSVAVGPAPSCMAVL